jgi:hypothetical protein
MFRSRQQYAVPPGQCAPGSNPYKSRAKWTASSGTGGACRFSEWCATSGWFPVFTVLLYNTSTDTLRVRSIILVCMLGQDIQVQIMHRGWQKMEEACQEGGCSCRAPMSQRALLLLWAPGLSRVQRLQVWLFLDVNSTAMHRTAASPLS